MGVFHHREDLTCQARRGLGFTVTIQIHRSGQRLLFHKAILPNTDALRKRPAWLRV
jgi:hypothetical protein